MTIYNKDIAAAQAAYAALPFIVRCETDLFAGAFRFATRNEALAYVTNQAGKYRRDRRHGRRSTWLVEMVGPQTNVVWDADDITDGVL